MLSRSTKLPASAFFETLANTKTAVAANTNKPKNFFTLVSSQNVIGVDVRIRPTE